MFIQEMLDREAVAKELYGSGNFIGSYIWTVLGKLVSSQLLSAH